MISYYEKDITHINKSSFDSKDYHLSNGMVVVEYSSGVQEYYKTENFALYHNDIGPASYDPKSKKGHYWFDGKYVMSCIVDEESDKKYIKMLKMKAFW